MTTQNPSLFPVFIDIETTAKQVCLGKSTVLAWEALGKFPRAVRLSAAKRVWLQDDVSQWIGRQHENREAANLDRIEKKANRLLAKTKNNVGKNHLAPMPLNGD